MLSIDIDVSAALQKLEDMGHRIRHLDHVDIVNEIRDWEVEDVHRKRPGAHRARHGGWVLFRQHSRYDTMRSRRALRRLFRKGRFIYRVSQRPILRQSMIDRLSERLSAMLFDRIKWAGDPPPGAS